MSRNVVNWNQGDVANQFISGQAAMMVMGPWMLPSVKRSGVEFGIVTIPVPQAGMKPVVPLGGEAWCLLKNDKKVEEAATEFVRFALQPDQLLKWCLTSNYIAAYRSVAEKEGETLPDLQPFIAQMETARARPEEGGAEYPAISLITRQAIQKALTGQSSVDAALDDAAAQVKKVDLSK